MSNEGWTNEPLKIKLGEEQKVVGTSTNPITAEKVKEVSQANMLKKFNVFDEYGQPLKPSDFPYDGNVRLEEYNENK